MKNFTLVSFLLASTCATAQINDGSFEAGIGAGTWTEASVTFGTPLCDAASCGTCGGPCTPRSGSIYAWFGGSGSADEVASVEQSATIPEGATVDLAMWVKIPLAGDGTAGNYIKVYVDGNELGMITALDSADFADYTQVSVPIDAFADGAAHTIKIEGKENGTSTFNALIDDVTIEVDGTVIGLFENESLNRISMVPNPANDQVMLYFNALKGAATVSIIDLGGKVQNTTTLSEVYQRSFSMDTRTLANGVYIVSVMKEGSSFQQRLVVAH